MPEYVEYGEKIQQDEDEDNNEEDQEEHSVQSLEMDKKEEEEFKQELIRTSSSHFYAYLYLENSDQNKYNGIIKTLNQQNRSGIIKSQTQ